MIICCLLSFFWIFIIYEIDTFVLSMEVHAEVFSYLYDPRAELGTFAKLCYLQEALEHRILSDVFGIMDVCEHPQAHGANVSVMPLYEYGIGALVASTGGGYQVFIRTIVQYEFLGVLLL